eukprot:4928316-Amphidinium_carterae.1
MGAVRIQSDHERLHYAKATRVESVTPTKPLLHNSAPSAVTQRWQGNDVPGAEEAQEHKLCDKPQKNRLTRLLRALDEDKSGTISLEEMIKASVLQRSAITMIAAATFMIPPTFCNV